MTNSRSAPGRIHVAANKRGFGLGFGGHHQVPVYTENGPKTGALLAESQCASIRQWAAAPEDARAVTDVVPATQLVEALRNLLLHADTIELVRLLPRLLGEMDPRERALLFGEPMARIRPEMWEEVAQTRPQLRRDGFDPREPQGYFRRIMQPEARTQVAESGDDLRFGGVSMEIAAAVLPMAFEAIGPALRLQACQAIGRALRASGDDRAFFAPLGDANLNRLVVVDDKAGPCQDLINNGRTLMIRSPNGPTLRFQGDEFTASNLHFHALKNAEPAEGPVKNLDGELDDKPEFLRYRDGEHETLCRKEPQRDPNRRAVGQLHAIFNAKGKRALLLGADVELGEANEAFGRYVDFLKTKRNGQPLEIINDTDDPDEIAAKAVAAAVLPFHPLACYSGRFDEDGVPEAPFLSLHLGGLRVGSAGDVGIKEGKSEVYGRGVRVIYLADPITISFEQFKALRALQPVLRAVDDETCVHPRPRFHPG